MKQASKALLGAICLLHECCHFAVAGTLRLPATLGELTLTTGSVFVHGALADTAGQERGWWCVQFPDGDPQLIDHTSAMMLAYGFRLGITHYHEYRVQQRELAALVKEGDV